MNPFNDALHCHLLSLGYVHERMPADFDDGDSENGPGSWGHPAYDQYEGPDEYVFYDEGGVSHRENRDIELERWFEQAHRDMTTSQIEKYGRGR